MRVLTIHGRARQPSRFVIEPRGGERGATRARSEKSGKISGRRNRWHCGHAEGRRDVARRASGPLAYARRYSARPRSPRVGPDSGTARLHGWIQTWDRAPPRAGTASGAVRLQGMGPASGAAHLQGMGPASGAAHLQGMGPASGIVRVTAVVMDVAAIREYSG